MWFKELKKYIGLFILAVAIIVVYKTFDNFSIIIDWIKQIIHLLTPFVIGFCIAYVLFVHSIIARTYDHIKDNYG